MISLDDQIKKDKQKDRRSRDHRQNRDRSRDHYRSRQDNNRYNSRNNDDYKRHDYHSKRNQRSSNHNNYRHSEHSNNQNKTDRNIIRFTNLHYSVTNQQLRTLCEKFGNLKFCKIHWDKMGRSKETAVVGYFQRQSAESAVKELNHKKFEDMEVTVELDTEQRNPQKWKEHDWTRNNRY